MKMNKILYEYDIYPKVFLTGRRNIITIQPLGDHVRFDSEKEYTVTCYESSRAQEWRYAGSEGTREVTGIVPADGKLIFALDFPREGMYHLFFKPSDEAGKGTQLRVYALDHDMAGRYPYKGDLHMHTCRSDGHESPDMVCANYRGHGYDFTVISDHGRYWPSLEARKIYGFDKNDESPVTDLLIVQGEEVHLPGNDAHFVHFGGSFSINALIPRSENKPGNGPEYRSFDGVCPPEMTREEFDALIEEKMKSVDLPVESERRSFATMLWECEMAKQAGGLSIFPHPYWLCDSMQLSESFLYYLYEHLPFDAFEVLGGESYYQHNGFQTSFYYEEKAKGFNPPVVGSTDSHGSTEYNRNALICSTLVFAPENKTRALIDSIRSYYSVAVDSISEEYRLVGDFRWVKYGSFLLEEYFPLHDALCAAEGTFMRRFVAGEENAEAVLRAMKGETDLMRRKYFDIEEA